MKSVDLTLELPEWLQLPLPDDADGTAVTREEVLSWEFRPADDVVRFLALVVGDLSAVREQAASLDVVRHVEFASVDDDTFYVYAELAHRDVDETLRSVVATRSVVVVPPVVYTDVETVHLTLLGEEAALSGVVGAIPDAVDVTVERLGDHGRLGGSLAARLTARQFEAVATAERLGYYDVPKSASLSAVADELGCSKSAASSLLRRANGALARAALGRRD